MRELTREDRLAVVAVVGEQYQLRQWVENGVDAPNGTQPLAVYASPRRIAEAIVRARESAPKPGELRGVESLSPRELELVRLLYDGNTVVEVAQLLFISAHTARNHLKHVFRKLGVHSQVELLAKVRP